MTGPAVIADMLPVHLEACYGLWQSVGFDHESDLVERMERLLRSQSGLSKVALIDGGVVGCVVCNYNEFSLYVFRLVVDAAFRGRGIGTDLMMACESVARDVGAAKIVLYADDRTIPWYELQGYQSRPDRLVFKKL